MSRHDQDPSPTAGHGWAFLPSQGQREARSRPVPEGCLASRVASCSCELLTEVGGHRAGWSSGGQGWRLRSLQEWPDRHACFPPAASPAVDLPWHKLTAAVVTAPHSRAREAVGESLVTSRWRLPSWIPWSPQATRQQQHRCSGALPLPAPPSGGPHPTHRHPQAPPKPF